MHWTISADVTSVIERYNIIQGSARSMDAYEHLHLRSIHFIVFGSDARELVSLFLSKIYIREHILLICRQPITTDL